ncbi:MAG: SlyX family protein [Planctomycetaceae bacterium]|nr:SlyX family protein [Planctomycetaceae bacterium]
MAENIGKPSFDLDSLQQRMVTLESTLAYLQFDFEQLNGVVLEQQKQIQEMQRNLERMEEQLAGPSADLPDPLDDTPPHY